MPRRRTRLQPARSVGQPVLCHSALCRPDAPSRHQRRSNCVLVGAVALTVCPLLHDTLSHSHPLLFFCAGNMVRVGALHNAPNVGQFFLCSGVCVCVPPGAPLDLVYACYIFCCCCVRALYNHAGRLGVRLFWFAICCYFCKRTHA